MYYTKHPFFLGEPPYDTGGGSAPGEPANTAKPPASFFNAAYTPPTQPVYQPDYQSFFPPQRPAPTTVRPPLAPPTIVRPPIPTPERTYRVDVPTGVAVSQKQQPPAQTYVPPPVTPAAPVYAPTNTQTNAPVYTGSTATHAEGGGYKGPTPVFATWSPGGSSSSSSGSKQSAQDRRKANQIRAEQNKKAREQAAKTARERQSKQQRKQADEYNKQQKKAAEAEKRQAEQYFKQMEAQEKALMKDREAQVKAQRDATKQQQILAKQQSQLEAQRQQMDQQRRAQQAKQQQAAEKMAQAATPTSYPYDTSANKYPETGMPPPVQTKQAQGLVNTVYFTQADIEKTKAPWGQYTSSSGDRIVSEIMRRGDILKAAEPKLLTDKRKAEMDALLSRADYLSPEEQARLKQLKSFMTPNQQMIADAALGAPRKELENMTMTILKKFGTSTSPSAGGLISPESTEEEQSAAYGQRATEFASTWNQQFNEMTERVDLLKRLEEEKSLVGKNEALSQLRSRLTDDEYKQLSKGLVREGAREAREYADKLTTKEQPSIAESLFKAVFATPSATTKATEAANVRDLGPDYKQWIAQQTAQPAPVTQLPPEGWIADPRYGEQQALQQKFDYPVFGDNLTQLETAVAPMQQQPSVADQAAANIAEIQKQISANDQQVAAANERLSVPIETYQPFKSNLLDTEEAVAREYLNQQPSTPMTVLDKVPVRPSAPFDSSYGITDLISDVRSNVSAAKMYSSPTSLLDVRNIGPGIMDLERMKNYAPAAQASPVSFGLLRSVKVPEINQRTAVPIDYAMRSAKTVISPYAKELASALVPQEYQKEAYDAVDAAASWGSKMATDTQVGDTARAYLHRYAFERGPVAETVGAAAQRVGGSIVNVAQKIPGVTRVAPYATKAIRMLASQPVSVAGAIASGVVDAGRIYNASEAAVQAERDLEYQKQDYEQLRNERINTMNREEARLADRKKVLDYRIGEYDRWLKSGEFYNEGAWGREKFARAMDKIALMKEQLKLVDDSLQNISQDRLKDAQQYKARGLQAQEAARRQAEAEAIERMNMESLMYTTGGF